MSNLNLSTSVIPNQNMGPSPWEIDPLLGLQPWNPLETASPKMLLIDDDPLFCAEVGRKAKKMRIDLTVCKTLGDLARLSSRPNFDVVVLDYFFGESLTAFQLAHLFSQDVPIVLVSNTDGKKLSGDTWPPEIRTFVHKSAGIDAIIAEAFLAAHWAQLVPTQTEGAESRLTKYQQNWWFAWVTVLAAAGALGLIYFSDHIVPSQLHWDSAPFVETYKHYSYKNLKQ